jgi:hypothetical protein
MKNAYHRRTCMLGGPTQREYLMSGGLGTGPQGQPPLDEDQPFHRIGSPLREHPPNTLPYPGTEAARVEEERIIKIRPNDLMIFNPAGTKVSFFVRRCQQIAALEGERAVLRVLLLCLKGEALVVHLFIVSTTNRDE